MGCVSLVVVFRDTSRETVGWKESHYNTRIGEYDSKDCRYCFNSALICGATVSVRDLIIQRSMFGRRNWSCLVSVFVVASGGVGNNNNMQEKVTKDLRTRLDAVHRNDIDCNTCVRVNEFLHAELVEMEEETNVDAIENEEELAKHHAKEIENEKTKTLTRKKRTENMGHGITARA